MLIFVIKVITDFASFKKSNFVQLPYEYFEHYNYLPTKNAPKAFRTIGTSTVGLYQIISKTPVTSFLYKKAHFIKFFTKSL